MSIERRVIVFLGAAIGVAALVRAQFGGAWNIPNGVVPAVLLAAVGVQIALLIRVRRREGCRTIRQRFGA